MENSTQKEVVFSNGSNGSVAACRYRISSTAAIECIPAVPERFFKIQNLNGSFSQEWTFKSSKYHRNEGQLTARSGHCKLSLTMKLSGRREAAIHCSDWFGGAGIPP